MFSNTEELLPVISFNSKTSAEEQKKHDNFVERMMEKGYTPQTGATALRMVSPGYASHPDPDCSRGVMAHFIDRRLNGKNKALSIGSASSSLQEADQTSGL